MTAQPSPAELGSLVLHLRDEPCVNSWRTVVADLPASDPATLGAAVLSQAASERPTTVFVYSAAWDDGRTEPVAFATIAERVSPSFSMGGFPVVARGFVRPDWRGLGLYRPILAHRVSLCVKRWGEELRGVHLGSASPAVWHVVSAGLGELPAFTLIGTESLKVTGSRHAVRDYLWLTPAFRARVDAEAATFSPPFGAAVRGWLDGAGPTWRDVLSEAGGVHLPEAGAVGELLAFCAAVPLVA